MDEETPACDHAPMASTVPALGRAPVQAFLPTTDLDQAEAFFGEVLGIPVRERSPIALVLDTPGAVVRVTEVPTLTPQPFTVLGWWVDDIDAAVAGLAAAGVPLLRYDQLDQNTLGIWTAPGGARVAWFHDPDGNVLSVTQDG